MAENTKIEWCDHTINWWIGCTKVSPACAHCYAEAMDKRFNREPHWGPDAPRAVRLLPATREAFRYQRRAEREGRRFKVFTNSLSDFFEDRSDLDGARLGALDVIRRTPNLDWLIRTKRPESIVSLLRRVVDICECHESLGELHDWIFDWITPETTTVPPNVWIGTTAEDQACADKRIPSLLQVPAAVRFLSCEPLLGPINLGLLDCRQGYTPTRDLLHQVIAGGESGAHARPMHPDWVRSLRDQCVEAGVPFLFKQWGEFEDRGRHGPQAGDWAVWPNGNGVVLHGGQFPTSREVAIMRRVGRARAGRLLDGAEHNGFPEVRR